jgi:hypothetical protein
MKNIQPINIWVNGQVQSADTLQAHIIYDDLLTRATFYYQLMKGNEVDEQMVFTPLAAGNVEISGADYEAWGEDEDINTSAYNYLATQLNLTII